MRVVRSGKFAIIERYRLKFYFARREQMRDPATIVVGQRVKFTPKLGKAIAPRRAFMLLSIPIASLPAVGLHR